MIASHGSKLEKQLGVAVPLTREAEAGGGSLELKSLGCLSRPVSKIKWWPLIPALWTRRQEELCEFKASLVYRVSFRTARAMLRDSLKKKMEKLVHAAHAAG